MVAGSLIERTEMRRSRTSQERFEQVIRISD
jgi:hypothetical protein